MQDPIVSLIRRTFLNWPFTKGKGLLMRIFFPYLRRKKFRFELMNGVTIPGEPIDEYITSFMFVHGYEHEKYYMISHKLLREGDVVLDIGANMGIWSMVPAAKFGGRLLVHAFEPVPAVYRRLVDNIAANHLEALYRTYNFALSDKTAKIAFQTDLRNSGKGFLADSAIESAGVIEVEVRKLSDVRREFAIDRVDYVKIDVEGAEIQVLLGDVELFSGPDAPILFIEIIDKLQRRFGRSAGELTRLLESWGYEIVYLNEKTGKIQPLPADRAGLDIHDAFAFKPHSKARLEPFF